MDNTNRAGQFNEEQLEAAIIDLLGQQHYTCVNGADIARLADDVLLRDDMLTYIQQRYASANLSDVELGKIINRIHHVSSVPLYAGNKETFKLVNSGFDLMRDDFTQLALHVEYIDFDSISNNIFRAVSQYTVTQGSKNRRPDVLLFVNGIPVAICEFKSAIREDATLHDAWEQITTRYCRDIPNLMKYCFLSIISDGVNTKMGSIFTPYHYYYSWNKANDNEKVSDGISSLVTLIRGALAPDRIVSILRDFVFYPDTTDNSEAIVCRYPQYFATNKMLANIAQHMKPLGDGKGGTYFGATGCGKTYTMMFLARMLSLRDSQQFSNPTVIIITDREDLDSQTSKLFVTATEYLRDTDVRSIESREDLGETLRNKPSGGVYITTIQKFCESTGLLSNRNNIICISDEAHRTQTSTGQRIRKTEDGIFTTYGFAGYLKKSFPNATYCGFTGTPIDETIAVFGETVDSYTMKESTDDGITVRISYEPRLARVLLSDQQVRQIQEYYDRCTAEGANPQQVEESQRAMSTITAVLSNPEVIDKLANDMIQHYEALCRAKPNVAQKAMIVCADRKVAFQLLQRVCQIRPEWAECKKCENEQALSAEQLDKLNALPKINLVATQGENDPVDLSDACGTKEYRKMLDAQFKDTKSNFKIAVVVDMWITGFDVPSLAVMYINKPLRKHTLIQTISRVNRVFEGKDRGLIVDYIGIKKDMLEAIKQYGAEQDSPIEEINISLGIFRNQLSIISDMLVQFDDSQYYDGTPLQRLNCLNYAAEYIQTNKQLEMAFMNNSRKLKSAYSICYATGELSDDEITTAQFCMAIRSIIYKQTKGDAPDSAMMNSVVESMVQQAITCKGIENIVDTNDTVDIFSEELLEQLSNITLPITKFNALLKLMRKAIAEYSMTNKVKAIDFAERLKDVVDKYNNRDNIIFAGRVVSDFVDTLSDRLIEIFRELQSDKSSFEAMGITFQEKAFYDILIKVRDTHDFLFENDKCLALAKDIKALVDDKAKYAEWSTREDIRSQMNMDLTLLLFKSGYPPVWSEEVFDKVMEQAANFRRHME